MARILFRLTDRIARNLNAPGYHADGGGLYLQVSKGGTKSWVFRFTLRGKTRDQGLGSLASVNLAAARARAAESRALTASGVDPIEEAKAGAAVTPAIVATPREKTFREFADEYVDAHASAWRNSKHRDQWRATLAAYAYPVIGDLSLAAIDTPDVLRILEPMWQTKNETASRVRGRIESILAAASVRGLRPATNPATWVGHLSKALPKRKGSQPFAALPYVELPAFIGALRQREGVGPRALEFAILTASRSGEARGALWSEINLTTKEWAVPAERMKAGRPHVISLSAAALAVVEEMRPFRDLAGGFVFPGIKHGRPLSGMTLTALIGAMGHKVTAHGFRASFKTWAEQETAHPNVVIEASLAHNVGGKTERAYMRGDNWLVKRRILMDDWGTFCTSGAKTSVVELRATG